MTTAQPGAVLRQIRGLAAGRSEHQHSDDELLEAFHAGGNQAAFEVILRRHGPMVLQVCRRVLGGLQDAEDAFQATFLFLAQQAGSIHKRASLASWLHGVARRMATNARRSAARRTRHERQSAPAPASDPAWLAAWHEVQSILDEEIQRLPETSREPLVRCCLEHRSCAEVAVHLGLQEAAVRTRLCRARKLLERRLRRRGVSLTLLSAGIAVSGGRATAEVASALLSTTAAAAAHLASTRELANGMVSANVAALLNGASQAMVVAKIKTALVVLLGTVLLAGGTALVYGRGQPAAGPDERAREKSAPGRQAEASPAARSQRGNGRTDWYGDPLPDEALARLGTTRFRPGEHVRFLRFTPDGAKLITQSESGMRVWDAATGRELRRFGPAGGKAIATGDVSADGKLALTADADQRGAVRLWDVGTGRQLRECGQSRPFGPVRLAPDGKTIAAPGPSGEVELRDATTGKWQHVLKGLAAASLSAAFSVDSKTLVTGGADKTVRLWDVATGRELRRMDCPEAVSTVVLSPDGKLLASVGIHKENRAHGVTAFLPVNRARIWDVATGKELRQLAVAAKAPAQAGFVAISFTPDSKTLVTLGIDHVLRVWDPTTGKELRTFAGYSTNLGAMALAPDGKSAAIVNGGTTLRIVDLGTGKDRVPLAGHGGGVYDAAMALDGRTVFTAGGDDSIRAWDASTGKEVRRLPGHARWVSALALSPDGGLLYSLSADGKVRAWDTTVGRVRQRLAGDYDAVSKIGMMALSADGKLLAAASVKKSLVLLDAASGKPIRTMAGLEGRHCSGAGFVPDGRTLVAWTAEQEVYLIDVATGKTRKRYPFAGDEDKELSYAAALSPDGRLIAFGSQRQFLSVLEVATGEEVRRFDRLPDGVSSVAFSLDGRSLAWGGWNDPTVHLIELSTREERHQFIGHKGRILALHFSPDARVLISGGTDGTALIWDLAGQPGPKAASDKDPSAEELASLWKGLGAAPAPRAYQSVRRLARSPAGVKFLGTQVLPVAAPEEKHLAKLIAHLDSDDFTVRDKATRELERLGDSVAGACRKALANPPSLEARRRLEKLLDRQSSELNRPSAERVRLSRALEALELAGTGLAREVVAVLAKGAPGAWLTEQAKAARERLDRRRR